MHDVELKLSHLSADVCAWANLHRMALNASKTKSMLLASPQKLRSLGHSRQFRVAVDETAVEQKFGFINGVDNVNWPPYRDSKS